jgi:acyl carrier protein
MTNGYGIAEIRSRFLDLLVEELGISRSEITDDMKLSNLGFNTAGLIGLAQRINGQGWMHGARIKPEEIVKCNTVNDVVGLIYKIGRQAGV